MPAGRRRVEAARAVTDLADARCRRWCPTDTALVTHTMDILAHALWAGAGAELGGRRRPLKRRAVALIVALAALPDTLHLLPIAGWWLFGDGTFAALRAYAIAVPGHEPPLPATVQLLSHHLHCIAHSAVVAALTTLLLWVALRSLWIPLLGWWSHIVIDVLTHSADYYPVPVLYPITDRGFDGLAWNTPWFMVANYAALGMVGLWLLRRRSIKRARVEGRIAAERAAQKKDTLRSRALARGATRSS